MKFGFTSDIGHPCLKQRWRGGCQSAFFHLGIPPQKKWILIDWKCTSKKWSNVGKKVHYGSEENWKLVLRIILYGRWEFCNILRCGKPFLYRVMAYMWEFNFVSWLFVWEKEVAICFRLTEISYLRIKVKYLMRMFKPGQVLNKFYVVGICHSNFKSRGSGVDQKA